MKNKTHTPILRALLAAFVILATGAAFTHANNSAQPTKPNPFDGIINRVMHVDDPVTFDECWPLFEVNFKYLSNYEPVQTEGCTILEIYNVTKDYPMVFDLTELLLYQYGIYGDYDHYMPYYRNYYPMSCVWVNTSLSKISNGDLLRITFKIPNDAEYESPEFELYAPFMYNPSYSPGSISVDWE